jgi:CDP-diacylglycerol--glycerol-3-phosphate 3-phosphatidyltransferase
MSERAAVIDVPTQLGTVPNAITAARTLGAVALAVAAVSTASAALAVAAYLCYWIGDVLDGAAARLLRQETRAGAVFDIIADRACCGPCAGALLVLRPDLAVPVGVFLCQFLVLDCLLSLAFVRWPVLGPNYFATVHPGVYRWNWSPPAKAVNTAGVVTLALLAPTPWWATGAAAIVLAVKAVSLWTVARLGPRSVPRRRPGEPRPRSHHDGRGTRLTTVSRRRAAPACR